MVGKPWRWLLGSRVLREVASERALQVPRPRSCCGALCFLSKTFIQSGTPRPPNRGYFLYLAQRMCQIEKVIVAGAGYSAPAVAAEASPAAPAESAGVGAA